MRMLFSTSICNILILICYFSLIVSGMKFIRVLGGKVRIRETLGFQVMKIKDFLHIQLVL